MDDAIVRTMRTAGRAVILSGATVAIGLAMLIAMPLPFMRTDDIERGLRARLARAIMRRPSAFLAAGTAVLVAAALPVFALVPRFLVS